RTGKIHPSRRPNEPSVVRMVTRVGEPIEDIPLVLTPSGPTRSNGIDRGLQLVGADPVKDAYTRVVIRSLRFTERTFVSLKLKSVGHAWIPQRQQVWLVDSKQWVEPAEVSVGDRVYGVNGALEVVQIEAGKQSYSPEITDVSAPDTYFLNGVLVRERHPSSGETTPLRAEEMPTYQPDVDFRTAPDSYDCNLSAEVTIRKWPVGAESIALLVDRHPGPSGALLEPSCDPQRVFSDIPHSLWGAWKNQSLTSSRPMTLAFETGEEGWEAEKPGFDGIVGCSNDVSLLACARDAKGSLTPLSKMARWGFTGPACFVTGTPIDTPNGPVAIEELHTGASVLAFDVARGEPRTARVLRRVSRGEQPTLQLRLTDGEVLRVTGEHPLWSPRQQEFVLASKFQAGDWLLGRNGREIRIEEVAAGETTEVWDLSVDGPDTYFANGVLAHNY
ncbi:MAG: Hint domain-containing protein, partial [Nannocystaceae bacterium]